MKSILILIALLIFSLSFIESSPIHVDESELFMDFNDLITFSDEINESAGGYHTLRPPHHPKHPKHPEHPKHPNRAYTYFPSPPDIAAGVIVFWECNKNTTIIYGQFSKGFVEGKEDDYSFKVYKSNQEIYDLKPEGGNLDKIFKINPNGSTAPFLFAINDTLISTQDVVGGDFVISKPDALIGKDKIKFLTCR